MEQRKEVEENELAAGHAPLADDFRINPNLAARDELMKLPRIGETLANRIIETRDEKPFHTAEVLMCVPGIKENTLEKIRPYLDFGKR